MKLNFQNQKKLSEVEITRSVNLSFSDGDDKTSSSNDACYCDICYKQLVLCPGQYFTDFHK